MIQTSERVINRLFMRLAAIYGHKWHSAYPTEEAVSIAKREWQSSLIKFDVLSLKRAINHCRANVEWPPSLPEFIRYCQPDYGLPDVNSAYQEACKGAHPSSSHEWSHPAVYHAAVQIGYHELTTYSRNQSWPLFEQVYKVICRRIHEGEILDEPVPKAMTHQPSERTRNIKTAKEAITNIYARLGLEPPQDSIVNSQVEEQDE